MNQILDKIREELIESDISGADLRIALDIINKYKTPHVSNKGGEELTNYLDKILPKLYELDVTYGGEYCKNCPNNINNGGDGICNCILGSIGNFYINDENRSNLYSYNNV